MDKDTIVVLYSVGCEYFTVRWPLYLVYLGSIVVAICRWRHHPRVSRLCLLGVAVLWVNEIAFLVLGAVFAGLIRSASGWLQSNTGLLLTLFGILEMVVAAVGFSLVIAAVFVGRTAIAPEPVPRLHASGGEPLNVSFREEKPS